MHGRSSVMICPRRDTGLPPVTLRGILPGEIREQTRAIIETTALYESPERPKVPNNT